MHKIKQVLLVGIFLSVGYSSWSQLSWPAITAQTKPWTRWWWMGSAVNKKDLSANMEKYKAAGLGGLELTPIYGVAGYEKQFIDYLSPQWMDMFTHTLQEAKRLGIGIDMSTGTGWPFGGGPLITSEYASKDFWFKTYTVKAGEHLQEAVSYMQEPMVRSDGNHLVAPATYRLPGEKAADAVDDSIFRKTGRAPDITQLVEPVFSNKNLQAYALDQVRFKKPLPLQTLMAFSDKVTVVNLTAKVDATGNLDWTAPDGNWTLYAIFQGWHGKMVERAAPGAEGFAIDHFSAAALNKYLSRFDKAFTGHDISALRAFFNDSYEVDDARGQSNWTPGFFEAFKQYRGYDLREHLPALLGKDSKEINGRVLCDYRETISDLLLDKFTVNWRKWAATKGAIIRNQSHGSPANILDLYAASDIPETEGNDILRNKFATSAAHVTGKKLASSESVTWLNEHFLSSLADVKKAVDNFLLAGVNHIFYHGTAYSPQSDPWPGWLFYASVHFTPNDPSWKNFPVLNNYIAKAQSFLQQGKPANDVLLYCPFFDRWSDAGRDFLKHFDGMDPEFTNTPFKANADSMLLHGYAFDYISDRQVQQIQPQGAMIMTGGVAYRTLVLPACQYISLEAFGKLIKLAEAGATIIVYKSLPAGVPGWSNFEKRSARYQQLADRLQFTTTDMGNVHKANIGKGAFIMGDDLDELLAYAKARHETMTAQNLQFVRRKNGHGDYYFIVNRNDKQWEGNVSLSATFTTAAIFNPMTGRNGLAKLNAAGNHKEVYLQLQPGESCIVQTFTAPVKAGEYAYYKTSGQPEEIKGTWMVQFTEGGPVLPPQTTTDKLGSWTELDGAEVKNFSGTATYSINFSKPTGQASAWLLDLGKVNETAEVLLNGKKIAALIGPMFQAIIHKEDMKDHNTLQIKVSNLMANRIADMDKKGIPWKKFYNTDFPARLRENRGASGLFDTSGWKPLPSGLSGPVTITAITN